MDRWKSRKVVPSAAESLMNRSAVPGDVTPATGAVSQEFVKYPSNKEKKHISYFPSRLIEQT